MALVKLGDKVVSSTIKLTFDNVPTEFIVIHQGLPGTMYDASCDGTWVMIKDCCAQERFGPNSYGNSDIVKRYFDETIGNRFDSKIKNKIKHVILPFNGNNGLEALIFPLSARELNGPKQSDSQEVLDEGATLDYFKDANSVFSRRTAKFNGKISKHYTRSLVKPYNKGIWICNEVGSVATTDSGLYWIGIRFAMILPKDLWVSDDGTVTTNTAPATPSSLTVPSQINGGSTITLSWGAATDAEGNLEGYKVERSLDGGTTWSQIYQGGGTSTTNTVPFGTETVMYRVKAYDSEGLESTWRTSAQVTVINNTAPTVPGSITVPEAVQGGRPLTISWGASSDGENNLAGYSLERQVDGGDWAAVYSGDQLSFTDSVIKGWLSVAYRVRAFDTASAYSGFAISETRQVNNNTPPAITCEYPGNTPLGVKNEGFEISYSVSDEEGDQIAVTEAVDGAALRTFTAELGAENSFALGGLDWMRLLNGRHTLSITAADGASSTAHSLSFTKEVTKACVTLEQPMSADGPITVCVLAASGFIPADAQYTVMVTNNANDGAPVWEDCTAAVRSGANHIFDNSTAEEGFAFNFKLSVERGPSGQGGYITSVQGGFQ